MSKHSTLIIRFSKQPLTVPVPLPSIDDQRRIVDYLDSVQAQAAALKRAQEDTDAELRRLEQAILDRAFRGEL
jgi:type I restriction enzyme S subunit